MLPSTDAIKRMTINGRAMIKFIFQRGAPKMVRIPISFVRLITVSDTNVYSAISESVSAITAKNKF